MGCWNKTCGLSGLHILSGQEVYVFVLEQNKYRDRCYSTAYWRPVMLPWIAKYNDYGSGEDDKGVMIPFIIDGIKKCLIEVGQGENEYHEIPVTRDTLDLDKFYEAVHEGRLKSKLNEEGDIDFVMMRKDVVDDILNTRKIRRYVGDGQGTTGWDNAYIEYGFAQILNELPEFLDALISHSQKKSIWYGGLDTVVPRDRKNLVSEWLQSTGGHHSKIIYIEEILQRLLEGNDFGAVNEVMTAHLKAQFIDAFMNDVRKTWAPGAFEGSQSNDATGYRTLHSAIDRALTRDRTWFGNDEEDES